MTPDTELLRRYAAKGDEAAFAEVVRRQVGLIYSVALRVANGNAALAEDVTQSVFTDLARKARPLSRHEALAGWLHTSARFAALKAMRGEQRRRNREQEATMQNQSATSEFDWEQLRPVLDEAVGSLKEKDRAAIVLRFFQGLSHREVGEVLGLNENTARKRVEHALEKMRGHFARTGITVSSALLTSTLSAHSAQTAPAGLAEKITKPSLATVAGGGVISTVFWQFFLMSTKTKIALAVATMAALIALIATGPWWHTELASVPRENTSVLVQPTKPMTTDTPTVLASAPPRVAPTPAPPANTNPPQPPAPTVSTSAPTGDPHDNLDAALDDIARLIRAGSAYDLHIEWYPPEVAARQNPQGKITEDNLRDSLAAHPDKARDEMAQKGVEESAHAIESLKGMTPTLNATGDEATYTVTPHSTTYSSMASELQKTGQLSPQEVKQLARLDAAANAPKKLVMVKINGKWYAKDGL